MRHYIKPNKKCELPQDIVAIDVLGEKIYDTNSNRNWKETFKAFSATAIRVRRNSSNQAQSCLLQVRSDCWEFLRSLTARKRKLIVVSNRMSRVLTLLDAWGEFQRGKLTFTLDGDKQRNGRLAKANGKWQGYAITNDPPFILCCRFAGKGGTVKFIDLRNYGEFHDKDFGEWPNRSTCMVSWFTDWMQSIKKSNLGNFADTVSRQAWNSWRHTKGFPKILVHDNQAVNQLERQAYYGGRCEARFIGSIGGNENCHMRNRASKREADRLPLENKIYHFDFSWHYPSVMRSNLFPSQLVSCQRKGSVSVLSSLQERYQCIARVYISCQSETYPVRRSGKTLYCRGKFWTALAGPELDRAIRTRSIKEVAEIAWYEPADCFSKWVDKLWKLRQKAKADGDIKLESVIKRLGNSLYGRFAMKEQEWIDLPSHPSAMPFGNWIDGTFADGIPIECRAIDGNTQMRKVERTYETEIDPSTGTAVTFEKLWPKSAPEAVPAIAAFITAYGREKLLEALNICGRDNYYYYDTDSLLCNESGFANLESAGLVANNELGKLRIVDTYDTVEILGYKMLKRGTEMVCGGIPLNANNATFDNISYDNQNTFQGIIRQKEKDSVSGRTMQTSVRPVYSHGKVASNGWVEPFTLTQ